ncbi:MAG: hypothetical protein RSD41_03760 [Kiritimatiellia bacterium]
MDLVLIGPGRIGTALLPLLQAEGHTVTIRSRRVYGDFFSRDFAPERVAETLPACDAVLLLAGLFELNGSAERMGLANHAAPVWIAECLHEKFPKAHVITFLDARVNRLPEALPQNIQGYVEGKRRLRDWTLKAARAWGQESGARVNGIAPGPILPPPSADHREKGGECLTPRPTIEDVHRAVEFLLRTASVTGQILYVAAGQQLL